MFRLTIAVPATAGTHTFSYQMRRHDEPFGDTARIVLQAESAECGPLRQQIDELVAEIDALEQRRGELSDEQAEYLDEIFLSRLRFQLEAAKRRLRELVCF